MPAAPRLQLPLAMRAAPHSTTDAAPHVAVVCRGLVISPLSFQSYPPATGFASSAYSLNNQYAIAQAAGVTSTRIYTTIGASNLTGCLTASCTYGGAVRAMWQARQYNMTGAPAALCSRRARRSRLRSQFLLLAPPDARCGACCANHCISVCRPAAVTVGVALPALTTGLTSFYTNSSAITAFLSTFNQTVLTLKTFPELLMWSVGNEISLASVSGLTLSANTGLWSGAVSIGWANMWSLVGTLAAIIHELDPYHPVGTATPNVNLDVMYNGFMRYANTLDLFGSNVYGSAATGFVAKVSNLNAQSGWARPFFASEFGATNWFNAPYTGGTSATGGSLLSTYLEDSSDAKAATFAAAYFSFVSGSSLGSVIPIKPANATQGKFDGAIMGSYAFQFGWIWQVRTPPPPLHAFSRVTLTQRLTRAAPTNTAQATATWVNMMNQYPYTLCAAAGGYDGAGSTVPGAWAYGGELAATFDTIVKIYTGSYPSPPSPSITNPLGLTLNNQAGPQNINLQAGQVYSAYVAAVNFDGSALGYQWMVLPIPSGGPIDHTTYAPVDIASNTKIITWQDGNGNVKLTAPTVYGQYRLSVWVYSTASRRFTTHNVPFTVSAAPSAYIFPVTMDTCVRSVRCRSSCGACLPACCARLTRASHLQGDSGADGHGADRHELCVSNIHRVQQAAVHVCQLVCADQEYHLFSVLVFRLHDLQLPAVGAEPADAGVAHRIFAGGHDAVLQPLRLSRPAGRAGRLDGRDAVVFDAAERHGADVVHVQPSRLFLAVQPRAGRPLQLPADAKRADFCHRLRAHQHHHGQRRRPRLRLHRRHGLHAVAVLGWQRHLG